MFAMIVHVKNGYKIALKNQPLVKGGLIAVHSRQLILTSSTAPVKVTRHKEMVVYYNKRMGGIDKSDRMTEMFEKSCISSHIKNNYKCIHLVPCNITGKKMTHLDFQFALVERLSLDMKNHKREMIIEVYIQMKHDLLLVISLDTSKKINITNMKLVHKINDTILFKTHKPYPSHSLCYECVPTHPAVHII